MKLDHWFLVWIKTNFANSKQTLLLADNDEVDLFVSVVQLAVDSLQPNNFFVSFKLQFKTSFKLFFFLLLCLVLFKIYFVLLLYLVLFLSPADNKSLDHIYDRFLLQLVVSRKIKNIRHFVECFLFTEDCRFY